MYMEFKDRLRLLRKEQSLTLAELSKAVGISQPTLSRYESGDRKPKSEQLKSLANYFNVSIGYLTGVDNDRFNYSLEEWEDVVGYKPNEILNTIKNLDDVGLATGDFQKDIGKAISTLDGSKGGHGTRSAFKEAVEIIRNLGSIESKYFIDPNKEPSTFVDKVRKNENNFGKDWYYSDMEPKYMDYISSVEILSKRLLHIGENAIENNSKEEVDRLKEAFGYFLKDVNKLIDNNEKA